MKINLETENTYVDYAVFAPLGLMTADDYEDYADWNAAAKAEADALAALEVGIDDGFDRWEASRGCYLDPQS